MPGFLSLLTTVSLGWITAGAMPAGAAGRRGWGGIVPRVGAAAVATFAILLLIAPSLEKK
jgi:hypothetical protein